MQAFTKNIVHDYTYQLAEFHVQMIHYSKAILKKCMLVLSTPCILESITKIDRKVLFSILVQLSLSTISDH